MLRQYSLPYHLNEGGKIYGRVSCIHDDKNRLVAIGRVRMIVLESGAAVDGKVVNMQGQKDIV